MSGLTVRLGGDLTIRYAVELREQMAAAFDESNEISLDLSGATDIDVSFLQLLIAAKRTAANERKSLQIIGSCASPLADRAARCGIDPSLLPAAA